jgi:hypothetical protein
MVNALFECGKTEYLHSSIEMVEKYTDMLEAVGWGEDVDSCAFGFSTVGSLGNPPRVRRKGGASPSSTRKTRKCTMCGKKGHNRQLCQVRMKTLGQSQVSLMESFNHDEDDDCNIYMVCFKIVF